jgi:aquaporin Z
MASTYSSPPAPTGGAAGVVAPTDERDVVETPSLLTRLGAEAFGTFGLVFVILGTALYLPVTAAGTFGGAIAAGIVLAGLIAALGHVSGGHFNPAVSLGAALSGRLGWLDMALYWVAQVVGGIVAAAAIYVTVPTGLGALLGNADNRAYFATTANGWDEFSPLSLLSSGQAAFDLKAALILEAVATAVFVAVTIGVAHRRAPVAVGPFAVGLTLAAVLLVTGPATGGGVNPARSTAAAIFAGGDSLGQLWLFWLAPLLGAAIVGLFALAFTPATADADDDFFEDDDEDDDAYETADATGTADAPETTGTADVPETADAPDTTDTTGATDVTERP